MTRRRRDQNGHHKAVYVGPRRTRKGETWQYQFQRGHLKGDGRLTNEDPEAAIPSLRGGLFAVAVPEGSSARIVGTGAFIGPGLAITATHVFEEFEASTPCVEGLAPLAGGGLAWWLLRSRIAHYIETEGAPFAPLNRDYHDVALIGAELVSARSTGAKLGLYEVEAAVPRIGERLNMVGFSSGLLDRESSASSLHLLSAGGEVTAVYPQGRSRNMPFPCVEVDMDTVGGMSGGPVFNEAGHLVGILSSSFEGQSSVRPSFISLVWPALISEVPAFWPQNFWPGDKASPHVGKALGVVRLHGGTPVRTPNGLDLIFQT